MTTFIAFEPEQFRELLDALRTPAPVPDVPHVHGPDVEPWQFHSPSAKAEVTAYLDDRNQIRHVALTRVGDVPKHWRRLYVAREG